MTLMEEANPASAHITNNTSKLSHLESYHGEDKVFVGNGECLKTTHIGQSSITARNRKLKLKDILVDLEIKKQLLSISKLTSDNDCSIEFFAMILLLRMHRGRSWPRGVEEMVYMP